MKIFADSAFSLTESKYLQIPASKRRVLKRLLPSTSKGKCLPIFAASPSYSVKQISSSVCLLQICQIYSKTFVYCIKCLQKLGLWELTRLLLVSCRMQNIQRTSCSVYPEDPTREVYEAARSGNADSLSKVVKQLNSSQITSALRARKAYQLSFLCNELTDRLDTADSCS